MKLIDLHVHSRHSEDGDLSVRELFRLAEASGINAISITDHDSVESVPEAMNLLGEFGVEFVPGVEVTTVFPSDGSQQHILGYFIDHGSRELQAALAKIRQFRDSVALRRIEAFRALGFILREEHVWSMSAGRAPTAASIMRAVLENRENAADGRLHEYLNGEKRDNRLTNFYRDYLTEGKPAYVPFESITTLEGIDAVKKADGIPVLAHPVFVKSEDRLDTIRRYGILGIEAISTYHAEKDMDYYQDYAKKHGLVATAGSDYHGPTSKPLVRLGGIQGNDYARLEDLRRARGGHAGGN